MAELKSGSTIGGYTIWHRGNFDPATKLNANANAVSASKLETPRTISTTGDGTWSVSFDGTTNTTATLTLASTGVTAGTYKAVTVDAKGRVTTGLALTTGLVTSTTSAGTSNVNTTNTNTYLNVVETVGASPSSAGTSTQIIGAGTVTVTSDTGGKLTITGAQNITGNAGTTTKLATARTINGVSFDGSGNITIGEPTFANPLATYASGDANALNTGGFNVRYLNSSAANKPTGTDHAVMTLNYSAIWSGQQAFDWRTGDVFTRTQNNGTWLSWATQVDSRNYATTIPTFSVNSAGLVPARVGSTTTKFLREDGTWVVPTDTTYEEMTEANAIAGTETTARLITAAVLKSAIQTHAPTPTNISGNAGTATTLQTARTIGGVSFNGSANINLPGVNTTGNQNTTGNAASATKLQTPRAINGVNFDGTANITVADSTKLPLTGGTLTGVLNGTSAVFSGNVQVGNGIQSTIAVSFLNGGSAQNINTGGVLASNAYADATKVPTNGIYSKGKVHTATAVEIGSSVDGAKDTDYVRAVIHPPTHTGGDWEHTVRDDATYAYYKLGYGTSGYLQLRSDGVLIASGGFSGNATTATQLETARTINGTSFNGSANITTANWGTARTLSFTGDVTGSASVNGSANVATAMTLANSGVTAGTYKSVTVDAKGRVTAGTAVVTGLVTATAASGTANTATTNTNTFLNIVETVGATPSTVGTSTQITGAGTVTVTSDTAGKLTITGSQSITGNAATASKLATARTINGVSFDGSANITVDDSTKVPLSGGTMTGNLNANALGVSNSSNSSGLGISLYSGANGGMPSYGLAFSGTATFGTHGSVVGDWATYFTMGGATNRGWIFKSGNGAGGNVASISAAGEITASSILSSGNITAFSDARLKDNITKIPDALNKLNQLKGVTYTRKDLASDKQYAGLIAQDVQKVLPEAVAITEEDIIAVDYNGIIGLLVEAIKELETKVAILEGK